jgi:formylglycine-generating enzyme required for sulfatase activity
MEGAMKIGIFVVLVLLLGICMPGASLSQTSKAVVIPLTETVETPLEPFAPVAADSPPNSAYSVGTNTVHDSITDLYWQIEDDNTTRSWGDAWNYCQDLILWIGGSIGYLATNWRLPTTDELMSIVSYGSYDPAINPVAFSGTNSSGYWSSNTRASDSGYAWIVDFILGSVYNSDKSIDRFVRCVRGSRNRDRLFKNNGNGTVTDLVTGLTWQREDDNVTKDWPEAVSYCNGLGLAGGGWRLPTIKELQSIVDDSVSGQFIDSNAFPGTNLSPYWSSTTYAPNSGYAWDLYFDNGYVYNDPKTVDNFMYVRCVR